MVEQTETLKIMQRIILCLLALMLMMSAQAAQKPRSWRQIGDDYVMQGDYKAALPYYEKWVKADPTDAIAWYNLACCQAVLKKPDVALQALTQAAAAGWSDSAHTAEDSDLESLHGKPTFTKLLATIAHNARTRHGDYTVNTCLQERVGQYLVVLPEDYDPSQSYPLVILLHGYGKSAEEFADAVPLIGTHDFIYAIPDGPYATLSGGGLSHLREADDFREDVSSAASSADWVVRVADDAMKHYPIRGNLFWVVGFSQGAALAHTVAAKFPQRVAGYAAHGGYFLPRTITEEALTDEAKSGVKVLITHDPEDKSVPYTEAVFAFNALKKAGVEATLETLASSHRFTPEVGEKVGLWLRGLALR
jgi:phospholipase/carboxylesterase